MKIGKKSLLILLLAILFVPLLNTFLFPKVIKRLNGAVVLAELPEFNAKSWFAGEFQEGFESYINDNIGVRPVFVRIRNQIAYSFFDEAKARGVIRGKDDYLYELNYIRAYNGEDFIGEDSILKKVEQIKLVQDTLQKMGKSLIVCLAVGKGSYYPEYIPEDYKKSHTEETNYNYYARLLKEKGVNTVDFNKWFLDMKDTCSCMLYPKYGIHWSDYGMLLAADSLIKYTEFIHGQNMPNLELGSIKRKKKISRGDYDIASGMNLLFQLRTDAMCYPQYKWVKSDSAKQPKVTVIADSFYWAMFNMGIGSSSFNYGGFWFYNNAIYPDSYEGNVYVKDVDFGQKLEETDVFILMSTDANLYRFPFGFANQAVEFLHSGK